MKLFKNKWIKTASIIILALCLAVGAAGIYYVVRVKSISTFGLKLTPSRDYEVHAVTYYLQNDPLWADEKVGTTSKQLGSVGCLVSCVASAITDLDSEITPGELNAKLTQVDGYSGADLIWYKINEAVPSVDYSYSRIFTAKMIEKDLQNGLLPIINVKYNGGFVRHWVLIIGAKDDEFLIYDPLNSDLEPIPLSTHGRVYSYRVLHTS